MTTPGILYIVATPIGNLDDVSTRGINTLKSVAVIAAEDTLHSQRLLRHLQISTPLVSCHQHNEAARTQELITRLQQGDSVAIISDAGTPLISDPGERLVIAAQAAGIKVVPIPGPCALIAALSASGLVVTPFIFLGFLPAKSTARKVMIEHYQLRTETLVLYEAPHRILDLITDLLQLLGPDREVVIARELTKQFETIHRDSLAKLLDWLQADPNQQRGEFVVVVAGAETQAAAADDTTVIETLKILLSECSLKQAVKLASQLTKTAKNKVYDLALTLK